MENKKIIISIIVVLVIIMVLGVLIITNKRDLNSNNITTNIVSVEKIEGTGEDELAYPNGEPKEPEEAPEDEPEEVINTPEDEEDEAPGVVETR